MPEENKTEVILISNEDEGGALTDFLSETFNSATIHHFKTPHEFYEAARGGKVPLDPCAVVVRNKGPLSWDYGSELPKELFQKLKDPETSKGLQLIPEIRGEFFPASDVEFYLYSISGIVQKPEGIESLSDAGVSGVIQYGRSDYKIVEPTSFSFD